MHTFQEAMLEVVKQKRRTLADQQGDLDRIASAFGNGDIMVEKRPWVDMPAGGESFRQLSGNNILLPAVSAQIVVVTFTVPRGKNGVITVLANQFTGGGWTEGTADLIWRLQADGMPFPNYNSMNASLGSLSAPQDLRGDPIRLYENQLIELIAVNVSLIVGPSPLLGLVGGRFYPIDQEGESTWL